MIHVDRGAAQGDLQARRAARWRDVYASEAPAPPTAEREEVAASQDPRPVLSSLRLQSDDSVAVGSSRAEGWPRTSDGPPPAALLAAAAGSDAEAAARHAANCAATAVGAVAAPSRLRLFVENVARLTPQLMQSAQLACGADALVCLTHRARGGTSIELTAPTEDSAERALLAVVALVCQYSPVQALLLRWYLREPAMPAEVLVARWRAACAAIGAAVGVGQLEASLREKRDAIHVVLQGDGTSGGRKWCVAALPRALALLLSAVRYGEACSTNLPLHRPMAIRMLATPTRSALRALERHTCALALLIRPASDWDACGLMEETEARATGQHGRAEDAPCLSEEHAVLVLIGPRPAIERAKTLVGAWLRSMFAGTPEPAWESAEQVLGRA